MNDWQGRKKQAHKQPNWMCTHIYRSPVKTLGTLTINIFSYGFHLVNGGLGACPQKIFNVTPSRMLENALLRNRTVSALLRLEFKINSRPKFYHLDKKELIISFK